MSRTEQIARHLGCILIGALRPSRWQHIHLHFEGISRALDY